MNIIDAIYDENLILDFFADVDGEVVTYRNWLSALRVLYGLPIRQAEHALIRRCTGRDPALLPPAGFDAALFLTGRRCGKSKVSAAVGFFEACLSGRWERLSRGEKGLVAVVAPTVKQARIIHGYLRSIFSTPLLQAEVVEETKDMGFELRNGIRIEMLPGDYRSIRGYTLLAAIIDEAAFFGITDESKVRTDTELIRAIQPALATTGGRLLSVSSPYAKRGHTFKTWQRNFGNDAGKVLVWNAPSTLMNPTLPQAVVDAALAEDLAAAKSEYLGEFRDDVGEFLPREVIERLVVPGRSELLPQPGTRYVAFADLSGGRVDDAALAIAHRNGRTVVLDYLRRWRPPFNPHAVCGEMAEEARRYSARKCVGDNFSGDFVVQAFQGSGMPYEKSDKPKSALYLELLPRLCSGEIELLDDDTLVNQLAGLERRTRAGGRDQIDHSSGGHDDLANAVAGAAVIAATTLRRVGAM